MQKNLVLNIVKENKWDDVLTIMGEKKIKVKTKGNLAIFNYDIAADFDDAVVCESRGIIIDIKEKKVVCRGFDKFFNFSESYASDINWKTAEVQEKIDGSIVKLYNYNNQWFWSTNGMIDAFDADIADGYSVESFGEIIEQCVNYPDIKNLFNSLDRCNTYIFELVSPYNKVVIQYKQPMLYHIGTRNNESGKEYNVDIGIIKPQKYPLHTLDECVVAVSVLNKDKEHVETEGFVVVDKDFNRIKIKSPEYVYLHHNVNNHVLGLKRVVELLQNEDFNVDSFLKEFPEYQEKFDKVRSAINEFYRETADIMQKSRALFNETGDRKLVWETFGNGKMNGFAAMMSVNNDISIENLLKNIDKKRILSYVKQSLEGVKA